MRRINQGEIKNLFQESGALLDGYFVLRSGRRSRQFVQCALALQTPSNIEQLGSALADKCRNCQASTIVALAMGGLVIGQEIARQLNLRYIFAEKENGKLKFRRGFQLSKNERVIVVDDVLTQGGSMREIIRLIENTGAEIACLAVLVDRSDGAQLPYPLERLIPLRIETFAPDPAHLPADWQRDKEEKPGS